MNDLKEKNMNTQLSQPGPTKEVEQSNNEEHGIEDLYVSSEQERENYLIMARDSLQVMMSWRTSVAEWTKEKGKNATEGCVKSREFVDHGRICLLQARLNIPPSILFEDLAYNTKEQPSWNSFVSTYKMLEELGDNSDVLYYTVPGWLCGIVQSRDFVVVRHHAKQHNVYTHSVCGVTHPNMPEQKNMVRGENGPSGWILESVPNDPDKCDFLWFSNTDVKVPLPKYILKTAVSSVMLDFLKLLRKRVDTLNQRFSSHKSTSVTQTANSISGFN